MIENSQATKKSGLITGLLPNPSPFRHVASGGPTGIENGHGSLTIKHCWLVVCTPLKNMNVNWDDYKPNMNGKIKIMFQTTNQIEIFHSDLLV